MDPVLEVDEHTLTLPPGKRSSVRLGVKPLAEGIIAITGASWTLHPLVHSVHDFTLHGRRLNETRKQRMTREYAFDQSLDLPVVGPMPLLQAVLEGLPNSLLLGQVVPAKLELTNCGRTPLTALRLRLSHPAFCVVAEESAADVVQGGAALSSLICAAAAPPTFRKRAAGAPPHKSGQEFATLSLPLPRGELQP